MYIMMIIILSMTMSLPVNYFSPNFLCITSYLMYYTPLKRCVYHIHAWSLTYNYDLTKCRSHISDCAICRWNFYRIKGIIVTRHIVIAKVSYPQCIWNELLWWCSIWLYWQNGLAEFVSFSSTRIQSACCFDYCCNMHGASPSSIPSFSH